jgi:hypothetical protein
MNTDLSLVRDLLENRPILSHVETTRNKVIGGLTRLKIKEVESNCAHCETTRPFHIREKFVYELDNSSQKEYYLSTFSCVSCNTFDKVFLLLVEKIDNDHLCVTKVGEYPQNELPRSKALSKFFKTDKEEYSKAVICLANGYGVAAFAYMRRIIENNILSLLEKIQEGVAEDSAIAKSINDLKYTSPMSDRIKIANNALPEYLKPDGFNPLGQIYGLLSDGVHSLTDDECLDKAENLQACLEFLVSELATHKQNKEDFKKRLASLRK